MAWLQNLAGKAEDLLNKIDKNAASVLSDSNLNNKDAHRNILNIVEPVQDYRASKKENDCDVLITIDKSSNNLNRSFAQICTNNEESAINCDNVSVISEKSSKFSEDDNGISFLTSSVARLETSTEDDFKENDLQAVRRELRVNASTVSSRASSMENSFILSDHDTLLKYEENTVKLELQNQDLSKQLLNLQHLYAEIQNENVSLQNQLERANESVLLAQSEMEQYRARAQRILQEKEKLITLKQSDESQFNPDFESNIIFTYNDELKNELEFQQEKNKELTRKLQNFTNELAALQQQTVTMQKNHQQALRNAQDSFTSERNVRLSLEEECRLKSKELQAAFQTATDSQAIITNKDQEITELREKLKLRIHFKHNDDLDSRLNNLTQTLIAKQSTLETVTTERNALRLQLEKLENEYHKISTQMQKNQLKVAAVTDPEEGRSQVPHFMKISPFDAGVTRRVKHAYSTLDAISIRTGVFLRRYPVARVFVFCYMVLLHMWVLIILFTYVPNSR